MIAARVHTVVKVSSETTITDWQDNDNLRRKRMGIPDHLPVGATEHSIIKL